MNPSLCLGTAQFGMNYGVTNKKSSLCLDEIKSILNYAKSNSINFLDTAQSYGNAEKLIGNSSYSKDFKIISKIPDIDTGTSFLEVKEKLDSIIQNTFRNLNIDFLDSLLFHDINTLKSFFGNEILDLVIAYKQKGIIKRIGISIYSEKDLEDLPIDKLDVVQLPLSIYDQRLLLNNTMKYLKKNNISIHVRSIFLQGIILEDIKKLPKFLSKEFINHHTYFLNIMRSYNTNPLYETLKFLRNISEIEAILFGISSIYELKQILKSWEKVNESNLETNFDYESFAWLNSKDLDPRIWSK